MFYLWLVKSKKTLNTVSKYTVFFIFKIILIYLKLKDAC
jgi:hypothetical protein